MYCYMVSFFSLFFLMVSYGVFSSLGCFSALLLAVVRWAAMVGEWMGVLAMGGSLRWVLSRLARVSKWSPESVHACPA